MDQVKIGKFISSCRKEAGLTQAALADRLGITDRAVSKWETGKSLPDASIMIELCKILNIDVNELLTGEHITMENYKDKAEENLLEMTSDYPACFNDLYRLIYVRERAGLTGHYTDLLFIIASHSVRLLRIEDRTRCRIL